MGFGLPLPPNVSDIKDPSFRDWLFKLKQYVTLDGQIGWEQLDFTDSDLNDIVVRDHNDLTNIQGGSSSERYHLTSDQHTKVLATIGSVYAQYTAAGALGGNRAVVLDSSQQVIYADSGTVGHVQKILGITTGAASLGATATVQTFGQMTEPSWSWTPGGAIYVSTTGNLTQTSPSTGFSLQIGFATSATQIFIVPKMGIVKV